MSIDKFADSQKKLELATNIVVAFINASGKGSPEKQTEKVAEKTTKSESQITDKQILDLLEKTFNKMHELVPYQERKVGLGH
jgi:hypothetical protein